MEMSKFIADRTYKMIDENNNLIVSYVVSGYDKRGAAMAYEESKDLGKLSIEVKKHKSQRSLEQNRLLWALLGKLAQAMSGKKNKTTSEEAYCLVLEENNAVFEYLLATEKTEENLKKAFRVIRRIQDTTFKGRAMGVYQCFIGSSKYNVEEMTQLIETTLDKLAEFGVYDSEIESARKEYQCRKV